MSQSLVTLKQLFKTMGSKTSNCFHKAPEKVYVVDQEDEKTQREKDLIRQMKVLRTELKMEKIERERAQVDAKEAKEEVMRLKQEFQEELLRKVAEVQTAPRSPALSRIASAEEGSLEAQLNDDNPPESEKEFTSEEIEALTKKTIHRVASEVVDEAHQSYYEKLAESRYAADLRSILATSGEAFTCVDHGETHLLPRDIYDRQCSSCGGTLIYHHFECCEGCNICVRCAANTRAKAKKASFGVGDVVTLPHDDRGTITHITRSVDGSPLYTVVLSDWIVATPESRVQVVSQSNIRSRIKGAFSMRSQKSYHKMCQLDVQAEVNMIEAFEAAVEEEEALEAQEAAENAAAQAYTDALEEAAASYQLAMEKANLKNEDEIEKTVESEEEDKVVESLSVMKEKPGSSKDKFMSNLSKWRKDINTKEEEPISQKEIFKAKMSKWKKDLKEKPVEEAAGPVSQKEIFKAKMSKWKKDLKEKPVEEAAGPVSQKEIFKAKMSEWRKDLNK